MKHLKIIAPTIGVFLVVCFISEIKAYNDDRRIVKWNPYWFSNSRYSPPISYYGGNSRGGYPKRLGERASSFGTQPIYKWSPVYFGADSGLFGKSMGGPRFLSRVSDSFPRDERNGLDMDLE